MTEAEARARIVVLCNADEEPVLAPADVDYLLTTAKRIDRYGVEPSETSWTETWDCNYAAAQGWLLKAGRLASRYLFMSGGKMFSRQQFYNHCMEQYRTYLKKSPITSQRLAPGNNALTTLAQVPSNWNP